VDRDRTRRRENRVLAATGWLVLALLGAGAGGCRPLPSVEPAAPTAGAVRAPTSVPTPLATAAPAVTATPAIDPIAAVVARQADLRTFRQALLVKMAGTGPLNVPVAMSVWAEGESARPNSRLQVGTDAAGAPLGFSVVRADGTLYVNPWGAWLAVEGAAGPDVLPVVPIPIAGDPAEILPLLAGGQITPELDVVVRGAPADVLRISLPPAQAERLSSHLLIPQAGALFGGDLTYTALDGEIAVGREDGFVRLVALRLGGYAAGDRARTFAIESRSEFWDTNDPSIVVGSPAEPTLRLPSLNGIRLPGQ
jgi:hypothetical protein